MASTGWHKEQDAITDQTVELADDVVDRSSPVFRTWWWAGFDLFHSAHLLNLRSLKRRSERFRVLDIGCGTGTLIREIAAEYPQAEAIGLEPNRKSVERACARPGPENLRFEVGEFQTARELGQFDFVICSEVFEHVEEPTELLAALHASVAPGGHLSFSTPSGWIWRRPSVVALRELVNSPVGPPLRPPRPAAIAERIRNAIGFYRRVRLHPQAHWREALPYHPATAPQETLEMLRSAGFKPLLRTSSIWFLDEKQGLAYQLARRFERRRPILAAQRFLYLLMLLESLLNLVPGLSVFESRIVVLARRSG